MLYPNEHPHCESFQKTLRFLSKQHMLAIVHSLSQKPLSFGDLQQKLKVNTATLTKRIKELEATSLVAPLSCSKDSRIRYYSLTEKGRKAALAISLLPYIV